jgi:hypothetical protein
MFWDHSLVIDMDLHWLKRKLGSCLILVRFAEDAACLCWLHECRFSAAFKLLAAKITLLP